MGFDIHESACVQDFFAAVQEQIVYKPVRKTACRELEDHLEDKTEEYIRSGMGEETAVLQAVKEMGDPTALGVKLNESYCLQNEYKLLGAVLIAVFGGILSNLAYGYELSYSLYFFLGIAVLFAVTVYGYRFCAAHIRGLTAVAAVYGAVWGGYGVLQGILGMKGLPLIEETLWLWSNGDGLFPKLIYTFVCSRTLRFNGIFLAIPLCAVLLFGGGAESGTCAGTGSVQGKGKRTYNGYRRKKIYGAVAAGMMILFVMLGAFAMPGMPYLLSAIAVTAVSYLALSLAAIWKANNRGIMAAILCVVLIGAVLLVNCRKEELGESAALFWTPEKQAEDVWEDGYNNVLIKELLGRSKLIGKIGLTEEEIERYGTGEWYFGQGRGEYGSRFREGENHRLEHILPQHYLNNYRIAYVILRYGWIAGILFLAGLAGLCGLFFYTAFRIRNRFGFLLAFGNSMALTMQILIYILGNFGYQLGNFPNLPFISEGLVSIVVNMVLAGLVFSAYRYDRVTDEAAAVQKGRKRAQNV